jgi:hypothetical protein
MDDLQYKDSINFLVFNKSSQAKGKARPIILNADIAIHRFVMRPNMLKTTLKSSKHHYCHSKT